MTDYVKAERANPYGVLHALAKLNKALRGARLHPDTFDEAVKELTKAAVTLNHTKHPDYPEDEYKQVEIHTK